MRVLTRHQSAIAPANLIMQNRVNYYKRLGAGNMLNLGIVIFGIGVVFDRMEMTVFPGGMLIGQ